MHNRRTLPALFGAMTFLVSAPVDAGVRQSATVVMPEDPAMRQMTEDWGYSEAIIVDDMVYVSGCVVSLAPGDTDIQAAYARAFEGLGHILARAGASWGDVVDMTTYHTNVATQVPAILEAKKKYVKAPYPAWTAVEVSRLIPERGITEIKLVAKKPGLHPRKT